jgi:hypothetical protein
VIAVTSVGPGEESVLRVVDGQVGVEQGRWDGRRLVGTVSRGDDTTLPRGVPAVWVQHGDDALVRDSVTPNVDLAVDAPAA